MSIRDLAARAAEDAKAAHAAAFEAQERTRKAEIEREARAWIIANFAVMPDEVIAEPGVAYLRLDDIWLAYRANPEQYYFADWTSNRGPGCVIVEPGDGDTTWRWRKVAPAYSPAIRSLAHLGQILNRERR